MKRNLSLLASAALIVLTILTIRNVWVSSSGNPVKGSHNEPDKQSLFLLAQADEDQGNVLKAFDQYYNLASEHYCPAQMKLYSIYQAEQSFFENPTQTFEKFQKMAVAGKTLASLIVGWMYLMVLASKKMKNKRLPSLPKPPSRDTPLRSCS